MSSLVNPHGSEDLKPLLLEGDALAAEKTAQPLFPKSVSLPARLATSL
jgi:hypothetical protein